MDIKISDLTDDDIDNKIPAILKELKDSDTKISFFVNEKSPTRKMWFNAIRAMRVKMDRDKNLKLAFSKSVRMNRDNLKVMIRFLEKISKSMEKDLDISTIGELKSLSVFRSFEEIENTIDLDPPSIRYRERETLEDFKKRVNDTIATMGANKYTLEERMKIADES